jgi:hypothetical protein
VSSGRKPASGIGIAEQICSPAVHETRSAMTVRAYTLVSSLIFLLVAVGHLLRLVLQWDAFVGGWHFPMWASVVAILVAGFLSFAGFRLFQAQRVSLLR